MKINKLNAITTDVVESGSSQSRVYSGSESAALVGGPQTRFGSTVFDYASATSVWDTKANTGMRVLLPDGQPYRDSGDAVSWLNDARAMRKCVELQGLGFRVVEGKSGFDATGEFKQWHKAPGATGGQQTPRARTQHRTEPGTQGGLHPTGTPRDLD